MGDVSINELLEELTNQIAKLNLDNAIQRVRIRKLEAELAKKGETDDYENADPA